MAEATDGQMRTYEYLRARSAFTDALKAAAYLELEMDGQSHDEFLTKALAFQHTLTEAEACNKEEARQRHTRAGRLRKKARARQRSKTTVTHGCFKLGSEPNDSPFCNFSD